MTGINVPITIILGLIAASLTALVTIRGLRQQRRLGYLQSILQVAANRVRLQSLLSSVRFLIATSELFPNFDISEENIHRIGGRESDKLRVLLITIYARERLFMIRNQRKKHGDEMEDYEKFLHNSSWLESWRSDEVIGEFQRMLLYSDNYLQSGSVCFRKFIGYVGKFVVWCVIEPQFDMIFAIAPRVRRKIEAYVSDLHNFENVAKLREVEKQIFRFYRGRGW